MKNRLFCAATIILAVNYFAPAQILNGSFEATSGSPLWNPLLWQSSGNTPSCPVKYIFVEDSITVLTIEPVDGQHFVVLGSGGGTAETSFSQLSQVININAGESITGAYFFVTSEGRTPFGRTPPEDDTATIKLIPEASSGLSEILLARKSVVDVGSYGRMEGWQTFSHIIASNEAGIYTLTIRVEDAMDYTFGSGLFVDALTIIPEPATLLLLGLGGLVLRGRSKK